MTATITVLALAALPALASASTGDLNTSGPYVGVGWGRFNLNIRNLSDVGTAASNITKSNDNAWKAFGGWRLGPYFALEAAYIDFGKPAERFSATGSSGRYALQMNGFAPSVVGSIPIGPVELFAKAGSYFYNVKLQVDLNGLNGIESSHSRNDFLYGGGVGVTIAQHVHLRAEYETLELRNAKNSDAFWLSSAWRF